MLYAEFSRLGRPRRDDLSSLVRAFSSRFRSSCSLLLHASISFVPWAPSIRQTGDETWSYLSENEIRYKGLYIYKLENIDKACR